MKRSRIMFVAAMVVFVASDSQAGIFRSRRAACSGGSCPTVTYAYPVQYQPVQTTHASPISVQYAADDGNGAFVNWINSVRASRGLRAVVWSPVLAADAVINSSRGFGHSFMGRARRQNAGWGAISTVQQMWLASPAHLDAILDPSATEVGLGAVGSIVTLNLR